MAKAARATISDVAKAAKTGKTSISRYLNGEKHLLSDDLLSRIEKAIAELDYRPSLMARGLKTLDIRMERHCANAKKVAEFFASHPAVDKVYYPGLDSFPGHEIAAKQMKLPGGMMAIELKSGREATAAALNKLQLCTIAVSLGDAETLVEHPATMTHSTYTSEELAAAGISEGLVRISVGLEDPEDVIADFKQALDTLL